MKIYHGSYIQIKQPDLLHSRQNLDFGKGFYTTTLYEQAKKWAYKFQKDSKIGVVSKYVNKRKV